MVHNGFMKGFVIGLIILLLGTVSGPSLSINESFDDELDQYQIIRNPDNAGIGSLEFGVAQSFKPTLNRLTRIELFAQKNGTPSGYLKISIRSSLEGDDLEYRYLQAEDISKTGDWYEIDFDDDILVEPERTYYIVWMPYIFEGDDDNIVYWCCNWYDNFYLRGEMWNEYPVGNWNIENPEWDCCFKTYGINTENFPPEPPTINGPKTGQPGRYYGYTFLTIDPNGDDVQYEIDWGDGEVYGWSYVCESDELFSKSHKWNYQGNFTIKARAKDIYEAVGEWSTYEVTMPRNKVTNKQSSSNPKSQNVMSIIPSAEKIYIATSRTVINNGSLLGYVNDTSMNGIEGALVRVHFHDTYEENYTDSTGYYHVTNIPICYCLKNATCSKAGFKTEWVLLGIAENTTHDFILTATNQPPDAPIITGPQSGIVRVEYEYNFSLFDSDGDSMYLRVDWGIGCPGKWYGPYASGSIVTLNYSWNKKGTYIIRAQAQDSFGFESNWGTLEVTMPRNKISANLMFQRFQEKFEGFFERFSNTYSILHRLLLIGLTRYV